MKVTLVLTLEIEYTLLNSVNNTHQIFRLGKIVFRNVTAKYPIKKSLALDNFSFEIEPGQKIGIVGQTGSGKSTIIKMLCQYLRQQVENERS